MKAFNTLFIAAILSLGMFVSGCVTHSSSDQPGLLGGNTHKEQTTVTDPITGGSSSSTSVQKTN